MVKNRKYFIKSSQFLFSAFKANIWEQKVNRSDNVALNSQPSSSREIYDITQHSANRRAERSSWRSTHSARAAGVHLLVCMCVSVRVCVFECEQVDIIFNFPNPFFWMKLLKWAGAVVSQWSSRAAGG